MAQLRSRSIALMLLLGLVVACTTPPDVARPKPVTSAPVPVGPDAAPAGVTADAEPLESPSLPASFLERRRRRDPTDVCEPVRENLDRAARAIVAADRRKDSLPPKRAWDHATTPKFMSLVDGRFALTGAERALLQKNGFVVPARLTTRGYADSLHEIYQSQLPIYVSADAILHAIFKSNDAVLEETETALAPRLEAVLEKMHGALSGAKNSYPPEIAQDADLYLTVARSLVAESDVASKLGVDAEAAPLVAKARKAAGGLATVTLFGRPRIIDFSQYGPRGHYVKSPELERYFRSSMWLSRLEMNLVSRASRSSQRGIDPNPDETPREAVLALALADLAERAQVLGELDAFDAAWSHFAGKREDVSIRALLALKKQAGITALTAADSADKLKTAIGSGFARTTRVHYMPQGSTPLPVIATMLGPRIVADATAETELVHAHVNQRYRPSFADVAFMLGHERAKAWLAKDLAAFPELGGKLEKGRAILANVAPTDMYSAWLASVRALAVTPSGEVPSYMKTAAFADVRVNSTVAAYGQIRHNYVLVAGQAYDEGGCEVPDGFVEPALAVYEGLVAYAKRGADAMKALGGSTSSQEYFARLESTMNVLVAIAKDELAGRALSEEEKRWLSMVVEIVPPSSDGPGSYDGWYFDLFPNYSEAFTEHAFVADWFTSSNANAVVYAGATVPRLGIFVVDTGGEPRVMVGPVARGFEHVGKLDVRLEDADVGSLRSLREPWAASYTAPSPAAPPLAVLGLSGEDEGQSFALRSIGTLGPVTLELLDHHRVKVGSATVQVGTGWTRVTVKQKSGEWGQMLRVRVGDFSREMSTLYGGINDAFGGMKPIAEEAAYALRERLERRR
jgi:hypothetical protein